MPKVDLLGVNPMNKPLNLQLTKPGLQESPHVARIDALDPNAIDVLTNVYSPIITGDHHAAANERLSSPKRSVRDEDVVLEDAAPFGVNARTMSL